MSLPRSTAQIAQAPSAVDNFDSNVTFTTVTAGTTVETVLNLPRNFRIQKPVQVLIRALDAGLVMGVPYVSGNAPSCSSCSPANYTLHIPLTNVTSGDITPTAQKIRVIQD